MTTSRDLDRVRELLGREPLGGFEIAVRDADGDPVVIANDPLLADGTPMPTRFWLIGAEAVRQVGRLEADGGVRRAESEIDPAAIAEAHARYATLRDALIPSDHIGPRPSGGVGGTREGVKCLHAHYAWHLAGGDDPVGRWVAEHLDAQARHIIVSIGRDGLEVRSGAGWHERLPIGLDTLSDDGLSRLDPPAPEDLTNALGVIEDALTEIALRRSELSAVRRLTLRGPLAVALAQVETGQDRPDPMVRIERRDLEEVFRLLVTEAREERLHNPGLRAEDVDDVVPAACIAVGAARRFHLDDVFVETAAPDDPPAPADPSTPGEVVP